MNRSALLGMLLAVVGCSKATSAPQQHSDSGTGDAASLGDGVAPEAPDAADAAPEPKDVTDGESGDGAASAKPVWVDMPGEVAGCKVQHLANPEQVRIYRWKPCDGISGCERAEYDSRVVPAGAFMAGGPDVGYFGGEILASHALFEPGARGGAVLFTREDGRAVDGYRVDPSVKDCGSGTGSIGPNGYAVSVCFLNYEQLISRCGGILVAQGKPATLFTLPPGQMGAPGSRALGDARWVWTWAMPPRVTSVSNTDGTDFRVLETAGNNAVKDLAGVRSAGTHFLFDELIGLDGGGARAQIAITDGVSETLPYVVPPYNEAHAMPGYAHTHVAWLRAVNQQADGHWERIEAWASPYTTNPSDLKPEKLGDCAGNYLPIDQHVAGHGYYASPQVLNETDAVQEIWDIAAKQSKKIAYPAGIGGVSAVGMTKTHAWMMVGFGGQASFLHRFSVN